MSQLGRLSFAILTLLSIDRASAEIRFDTTTSTDSPVIIAYGNFVPSQDFSELEALVASSGASVITFDSPGGNPYAALEMRRLSRSLDLATVQLRSSDCASACALAFMGGTTRLADPGSIGVHKSSFSEDSNFDSADAVSAIQSATADMMQYMTEMGVDPGLLRVALKYDSADIRYLSGSEMEQFGLTTNRSGAAVAKRPSTPTASPPANPSIDGISAIVRHPKGIIELRSAPDTKSAMVSAVTNGTTVQIIGDADRWYKVRHNGITAYAHHTWLMVDGYASRRFDARYIQVKSAKDYSEAAAYIRSSPLPLRAYLASNGWFAIALPEQPNLEVATNLLKELKRQQVVPDDAFITFGNTYVKPVCCD